MQAAELLMFIKIVPFILLASFEDLLSFAGLMVVAKDDYSHASLCEQFKEHTVRPFLNELYVEFMNVSEPMTLHAACKLSNWLIDVVL